MATKTFINNKPFTKNIYGEDLSKMQLIQSKIHILHEFCIIERVSQIDKISQILQNCETEVQIEGLVRMMTVSGLTADQFIERYSVRA